MQTKVKNKVLLVTAKRSSVLRQQNTHALKKKYMITVPLNLPLAAVIIDFVSKSNKYQVIKILSETNYIDAIGITHNNNRIVKLGIRGVGNGAPNLLSTVNPRRRTNKCQ